MPSMDLSDDKVNALGEERSCSICNTTKTPLWRGGPCGPKSLCNACGIKYRKKRRDSLGLEGGVKKERSKKDQESNKVVSSEKKSKSSSASNKDPLIKMKMAGLEGECVINKKRRVFMQLGEEERAAILLMTLSAGFVHG